MDFVVFSLGCKVNSYEGQSMVARLKNAGFTVTDGLVSADNYIINTCSVTAEADKKSRQAVSRVLKLNPSAAVYVCGCSPQNDPELFKNKNVKFIGGTGGKASLVDKIIEDIKNHKFENNIATAKPSKVYEHELSGAEISKTRGYIKIQDGCNNYCSYCIIPYLRGNSRSRNIPDIIAEANEASQKTKEIVLTGINVSAYGGDIGSSLFEVVKSLKSIPARKRFSSLECHIITEDFVKAAFDAGFCEHFHLSMQSGCDSVLKRMNRRYTTAEFIQKVELIRNISPNAGITTDIITGFAEETQREHEETIQTMEIIKFSDAHIFPYSERKGTAAYTLNQIGKSIRAARAAELARIRDKHKNEFLTANIGENAQVYFEDDTAEIPSGYSSNYIRVYSEGARKGEIQKVKINKIYKEGVSGEV